MKLYKASYIKKSIISSRFTTAF